MCNIKKYYLFYLIFDAFNTQNIKQNMLNKLLLSALSSFSAEDRSKFPLFVKSGDAVSPRKFYPVARRLMKNLASGNDLKNIDASVLFGEAYGKKYSRQTLLNRQSELLSLVKKYFKQDAAEKNEYAMDNLYAQELLTRGLLGLYARDYPCDGLEPVKNTYNEDAFDHVQQSVLLNGAYFQMMKQTAESQKKYFTHSRFLIADLLCRLYRTGQELQIQKYFSLNYGFNPVLEFIASLINEKFFEAREIQKDELFTIPLLRYYIFTAFRNPGNKRYIAKALKVFYKNEEKFTEYFRTEMYRMFMTYYIVKVNKGERLYYEHLFRLYDRKLKSNLVSDLRRCSYPASVFREYIIAGIKVKRFKWTENIITKYSPLLPKSIRPDEVNLANVRLCFAKREYEKAIELINNHKSGNTTHHIDEIRYKLACLYELRRYEEAYYEIDKSKHYLKYNKNTLPEMHVTYYKKFLDRVLKLLNYHANPYKKDPEIICREIENDKDVYTMKDWVTEKAGEIAGR